jgi:hypothetical protein
MGLCVLSLFVIVLFLVMWACMQSVYISCMPRLLPCLS